MRATAPRPKRSALCDAPRPIGGEGANRWFHVVLKEGRNREVRRLWESQGLVVSRLSRVRFGNIQLQRGQKPGKFRDLDLSELKQLYQSVDLKYNSPKKQQSKTVSKRQRHQTNYSSKGKGNKLLTPGRLHNKQSKYRKK